MTSKIIAQLIRTHRTRLIRLGMTHNDADWAALRIVESQHLAALDASRSEEEIAQRLRAATWGTGVAA